MDFTPMSEVIQLSQELYIESLGDILIDEISSNNEGIIILGGGNSPKKLNQYLTEQFSKNPQLKKHFFNNYVTLISDERYVLKTESDSNFKMLNESLFQDHQSLIPFKTELPIEDCIRDYSEIIKQVTKEKKVIFSLLGVGPDGHTASLFPEQFTRSNIPVILGGIGPDGHERISLSHDFLLSSQKIFFMVNSKEKEEAFNKARLSKEEKENPLLPFIQSNNSTFYTFKHKE